MSYSYTCPVMEAPSKPRLHQDWIDSHAYGIVKALQKGGFETYLVGGCVRDLLIGIVPKDYDIATSAAPPQVKKLIWNAYVIGRRFRLVLVKRDEQQFEVATFRKEVKAEDFPEGVPFGDNVFGTPEEDARRRDFTINGLFYEPIEGKLIDYVDAVRDIDARVLRMIGDPNVRLIEDPIRILRALRLAHKIGFRLDPDLRAAIQLHGVELLKSVLPRRREEFLKIFRLRDPELVLLECFDLDVLKYILPTLDAVFQNPEKREIFIDHFRRNKKMAPPEADTVHLFGWMIYSLFQTLMETEDFGDRRPEDIIEDERFQNLMRDELGMFKFEQMTVSKELEILRSLTRINDFKKRGERRQFNLVKSDGFALSLQMAEVDYLLPPEDLQFWKGLQAKFAGDLAELADIEKDKRRSSNRRRRPRNRGEGRDSKRNTQNTASDIDPEDTASETDDESLDKDENPVEDNDLTVR